MTPTVPRTLSGSAEALSIRCMVAERYREVEQTAGAPGPPRRRERECPRSRPLRTSPLPSGGAALVGTWKLVSAEDVDPKTGQWVPFTFGNPPCGYFLYDAAGHASIQIMTTPPTVLTTPDQPTPDEALKIFNGYIAYFGNVRDRREQHLPPCRRRLGPIAGRLGADKALRDRCRHADHRRSSHVQEDPDARGLKRALRRERHALTHDPLLSLDSLIAGVATTACLAVLA